MFALDLFNTKYEKELKEGAVDSLEARRIDDLNMKMLDLLGRAKEPAYKKNPDALAGLKKQFQKIKAERDSYFKINPATGMNDSGTLGTTKGKLDEQHDSPVAGAITRRILMQRHDLLKQYGPEAVTAAIDNVADYVGDVEEIGSSDVSGWVNQVERMLKENPPEAFREGSVTKRPQPYNDPNWVKNLPKEKLNALAGTRYKKDKKEQGVAEGGLEANTPNPVVVIQDLKGKILDKVNLSVAAQKYKLGNPQDIKKQLAHQNYTTIGNYVVVAPMTGQPQDATTQGMAEGSLNELSSGLLQRAAQLAKNKRNQAMEPELHNALGGGYMNPLAKHYDNVSQKINNRAAQVGKKETIQKIASPAVMRKIGMSGVAESRMSEIDAEYEDYKTVSPREFYNMYRITKQAWLAKYKSMLPQQGIAEDTPSPRAIGVANFQRLVKANMGNIPTVTLEFTTPKDNIVLDKKAIDLISDYYDSLENDQIKNHFIYRMLPSADEVLTVLTQLGWNKAVQPDLPGIPTQGELPLQEKKKFNSNSDVTAGDVKVARELQKLRAQYPAAKSDVEAVAKAEIDSTERSQQQLSAIKGANTEQDRLLKQLVALDKKQGTEIDSLDNENDRLEQQLSQINQTNARLAQAIGQMGGASQSSNAGTNQSRTIDLLPNAPADTQSQPQSAVADEPENTMQPPKQKSNSISRMAQDLSQATKVQGINRGPAPSIRGNVADLDQYRADAVSRAKAAIADKNFNPLANRLVNKGVLRPTGTDESVNEDQRLHVGDPIIVTYPNEFEGKTGEIYNFSPSGSFVIVDLYNHGKHSMHLSDVKYNDYADREDDWYDEDVAEGKKKRKKKSSKSMGGYFFPGYAYYGGGESGEGGGDGGESVNEFAPASGSGSGNYFQALASAWYNGAFDTGSLQKGIKSKEDVERLLNRGVVGPDGATRKYAIDYNSNFDGVVISSDDYYEHSDYNDQGQEVDSRTGQTWGPYDYMEFSDDDLSEGVAEAQTDYQKRRQRERDVDAGRPVKPVPKNPQTDYARKRAKDRKDMEMGEGNYQHGLADPNAPSLGAQEKNAFKRQELQHELGHERNNIAIAINGKTWKVVPGKGYADSAEERAYLNGMRRWAEKKSASSGKKWTVSLTGANPTVNELSTEKLAQYKTAAALDAGAADKRGDYERGDKRFAGIVKATKKQFANDVKKHKDQGVAEGLMKEPTNRKEYLDQRDKLFRMMAVDSNPANKQIIKQALQDLEARYGNLKNTVKEESSTASEAVERAILNRIMVAHTDLLMKFGPDKVMQAAEEVAYNVGDVDEIGTSDVSAYVNQVRQILGA